MDLSARIVQRKPWLYKQHLLTVENGIKTGIILAAYLLYFLLASGRKRAAAAGGVLSLFVIRSALWMYLYMVNRAYLPVTVPLLIMEFALLAGWINLEIQTVDTSSRFNIMKVSESYHIAGAVWTYGNL